MATGPQVWVERVRSRIDNVDGYINVWAHACNGFPQTPQIASVRRELKNIGDAAAFVFRDSRIYVQRNVAVAALRTRDYSKSTQPLSVRQITATLIWLLRPLLCKIKEFLYSIDPQRAMRQIRQRVAMPTLW